MKAKNRYQRRCDEGHHDAHRQQRTKEQPWLAEEEREIPRVQVKPETEAISPMLTFNKSGISVARFILPPSFLYWWAHQVDALVVSLRQQGGPPWPRPSACVRQKILIGS
jgi:hypothetical protein